VYVIFAPWGKNDIHERRSTMLPQAKARFSESPNFAKARHRISARPWQQRGGAADRQHGRFDLQPAGVRGERAGCARAIGP